MWRTVVFKCEWIEILYDIPMRGVERTDGGLSQTSSTTELSPGSESPGLSDKRALIVLITSPYPDHQTPVVSTTPFPRDAVPTRERDDPFLASCRTWRVSSVGGGGGLLRHIPTNCTYSVSNETRS